ncbi:MAG: precorrin-6y C5,15-methyltransferase (decarboxylating) subunit CbiE [Rhodothermaceae bacterium]
MNKIIVLGLGPGSPEYILPIVFEKVKNCKSLIGGKRNLEIFKSESCFKIPLEGKYNELKEIIARQLLSGNVGVAVTGDPGFHSLLNFIKRNFDNEIIKTIPGISSLQYLFSKVNKNWQEMQFASLHGTEIDFIDLIKINKEIAFLTDKKNSPDFVAKKMLESGIAKRKILTGEKLSYKDEKINWLTVEETAERKFDDLSVMVIYEN